MIRTLKAPEYRHITVLEDGNCILTIIRDGETEFIAISERVAEEFIAAGVGYDSNYKFCPSPN